MFTTYERETLRPIGNTALHGIDHRNRSASFGIMIGDPECPPVCPLFGPAPQA